MNNDKTESRVGLSVILPCYNPRRDYLARTMNALRAQSLPQSRWELVIVDNASDPALSGWVDVGWHQNARIVREEVPGLTAARLRGFSETTGELIVMVDDDNVLDQDYLETCLKIGSEKPFIGAFGAVVTLECEIPPARWMQPYLGMLGRREVPVSVWSNDMDHWPSTPIGAGMCVRREVVGIYHEDLGKNPIRKTLGRKGSSLVSGEDMDLAYTGIAHGYGMGVFCELRLVHLIPEKRLKADYMLRLSESIGYSAVILDAVWGRESFTGKAFPSKRAMLRQGLHFLIRYWRRRHYVSARQAGMRRGQRMLAALAKSGSPVGSR